MLRMTSESAYPLRTSCWWLVQAVNAWAGEKGDKHRTYNPMRALMCHLREWSVAVCGIVLGANAIHIWRQKDPRRLSYYQNLYKWSGNDFLYLWWQEGVLREIMGEEFVGLLDTLPPYHEGSGSQKRAPALLIS